MVVVTEPLATRVCFGDKAYYPAYYNAGWTLGNGKPTWGHEHKTAITEYLAVVCSGCGWNVAPLELECATCSTGTLMYTL